MHDDFDQEPIKGLPRMLPPGERILWQGQPGTAAMLRDVFRFRWVTGYFAILFAWAWIAGMADAGALASLQKASAYLVGWAVVAALLWGCAWAQAKGAVYTITTARVVMRTGAALTVTTQYPFKWIGAADLTVARDGTGTIALRTTGETRFSYLMLWPHARPWRFRRTQPALRSIPEAAKVARLLAKAVTAHGAMPVTRRAPIAAPAPTPVRAPAAVPAE